MRRPGLTVVWAIAGLAGLAACVAAGPGPRRWDDPGVRIVWPDPPERPRIEYVGAIRSAEDLAPQRGWLARLKALVLGSERTAMLKPVAVARNKRGLLVVADSSIPTLHFFQLEELRYRRLGEQVASRLRAPVGVAVDDEGRVYIADSVRGSVFVLDEDHEFAFEIGRGSLRRPTGLVLSPEQDRLHVVDTIACRVVTFDLSGRQVGSFGGRGVGPGEFNAPTHIAVGLDGRISVSDSLNFRVQVFEPDGTLVAAFGEPGDGAGSFARPKGIASDSRGRLYVVDAAFENVQVFSSDGRLLLAFGAPGAAPGEFNLPSGMVLDSQGVIWVADSFNKRVQAFRLLPED